jgi:hypothetical protein
MSSSPVRRMRAVLSTIVIASLLSLAACDTTPTDSSNTSGGSSTSKSVRCSATTQQGTRCERMTTNANGRCWQHQ